MNSDRIIVSQFGSDVLLHAKQAHPRQTMNSIVRAALVLVAAEQHKSWALFGECGEEPCPENGKPHPQPEEFSKGKSHAKKRNGTPANCPAGCLRLSPVLAAPRDAPRDALGRLAVKQGGELLHHDHLRAASASAGTTEPPGPRTLLALPELRIRSDALAAPVAAAAAVGIEPPHGVALVAALHLAGHREVGKDAGQVRAALLPARELPVRRQRAAFWQGGGLQRPVGQGQVQEVGQDRRLLVPRRHGGRPEPEAREAGLARARWANDSAQRPGRVEGIILLAICLFLDRCGCLRGRDVCVPRSLDLTRAAVSRQPGRAQPGRRQPLDRLGTSREGERSLRGSAAGLDRELASTYRNKHVRRQDKHL